MKINDTPSQRDTTKLTARHRAGGPERTRS